MPNFRTLAAAAALLFASITFRAQTAITTDPAPDKAHPAQIESFQLPSHGALLNALIYIAPGAGPHPVVILLHGFPGNEKNLDLAQTLRRAGYDVLYFNYRGSWGSPGSFSFEHCMEDTQAALAYLRDPANAARLRADPAHITLAGHSMGGMVAAYVGAHDPEVHAVVLISGADMAGRTQPIAAMPVDARPTPLAQLAASLAREGLAPLAGTSADALAAELVAHATQWSIPAQASGLGKRPVLAIASDDGTGPASERLITALKAGGNTHATYIHLATDHSYSDSRIALARAVLTALPQQP